ncbi:MAG: ribonuclease D [Mariprofundaceae bacterium]|nr:ribonuclease D [Mariprofundaceae bacterium]
MPQNSYTYIDTPANLINACAHLSKCSVLAVDTEFHRETTYYPEFALLQIYGDQQCWLIDPIALKDLTPIWDVLCNPNILKVFHAGRQDLEIILNESGRLPLPVFDTQVAAALLGLGQQIGFGNLVQRIAKKELAKQESFSDWVSRPLRQKQLDYAADDVIWLMPIYQHLTERLEARGRLDWLQEEQFKLCDLATYQQDHNALLWRVKGANRLKGPALAILRELATWREQQATQRNIPRRRLIADEPLLEISRRDALDIDILKRIRGLAQGTVRRFGDDLIRTWQQGRNIPENECPEPHRRNHHTTGTDLRLELLDTLLRLKAESGDISASILSSKGELADLASWGKLCKLPEPDLACLQGWRRGLVGEDLLHLLHGCISLCIDPSTGNPIIKKQRQP